jgi:hypothetical protein
MLILNEDGRLWRTLMNRHLLLGLIIVVLLAAAGCPPRQPPHTPQPYSMKAEASGPPSSQGIEDFRTVAFAQG